ncbi:UNVERIFIED_CONTAM: hypothetical protein FKN15_048988 [Acipenser sinensis]
MNTRCPPKRVPSAARFFTADSPCSRLRATASEDNAALGSLQASPQAPGQTTGVHVVLPKSPGTPLESSSERSSMHPAGRGAPRQRGRRPGRPRGRLPGRLSGIWLHKGAAGQHGAAGKPVDPVKIPKKRGPKPGSKRKPRVVPNPIPTSPTSSTPEPDTSTVPLDNATIPSAALQAPTAEPFLLENGFPGLPEHRLDSLDSALTTVNQASPARSFRSPFRSLNQSSSPSATLRRLSTGGSERFLGSSPRSSSRDPNLWTVEDVMQFVRDTDPQLGPHADLFRKHGKGLTPPVQPTLFPEHRLDSLDSALTTVNQASPARSFRSPFRSLNQSSSPSATLRRLSSGGSERFLGSSPRSSSRDPNLWTVEDVMQFVRDTDPQLGPHADLFRKHEIDGKALLLLRSDMMMKYMGLKLGPAIKLTYHIDRIKQGKF